MIDVVKEFKYREYECIVKKIYYSEEDIRGLFSLGEDVRPIRTEWYCGYVVVPNSKLKFKDDVDNILHGGITYQESFPKYTVWGFDCNHSISTDEHNNIEFVENNLKEAIDFIEKGQENER